MPLDQPVDRVVSVVSVRFDYLAVVVDGLLGIVPYSGDVPCGVIGVVEVLQAAGLVLGRFRRGGEAWRPATTVFRKRLAPPRIEVDEPEGVGVVAVTCLRPVAVEDPGTLAFCIVVDVGNERRPYGLAALLLAAQVYLEALQQAGVVVGGHGLAVVGSSEANGAVQGIIAGAGDEGLGLQ